MSLLKDLSVAVPVKKLEPLAKTEKQSLIKEFNNVQTALKKSDATDAGSTDVVDKVGATQDIGFNLMRNTINSSGQVTGSDVADYIERAEELNDEVETVPFGLETDDGQIVKVYVNAEQADKFEDAMKNMLGLEDDIEEAINRLTGEFDIVDVVWPRDPNADQDDNDELDDPDIDMELDDELDDPEDDADFADDQYDVVASADDRDPPEADPASGKPKVSPDEDDDDSDSDDEDSDSDDEDSDDEDSDDEDSDDEDEEDDPDSDDEDSEDDTSKKRKKKKAQPAEPASAAESHIPSGSALNETKNKQEKSMTTIGTKFLNRVLNEADASDDRDGVKDGFNIPLDSQSRALAAKLKLPFAKRLIAFHFMCGIPGRFMNSAETADAIAGAADMLRKKVAVRRAFVTLYQGLAAAKGYNIPTEDGQVQESHLGEAKNKRGGFIQKLLESVLMALGVPGELVSTSGPSAVGAGIYQTSQMIEQDSSLERALRLLAARLDIRGDDAQSQIEEAIDVGNDEFAQAVVALVSALGIPDDVLERRRQPILMALRRKRATIRNRGQVMTMMGRLSDLIQKNTVDRAAPTGDATTNEGSGRWKRLSALQEVKKPKLPKEKDVPIETLAYQYTRKPPKITKLR
uniref:hypothetical protein n=1 Tax=Acinetobacter sp. TaxID=472 RepID=UPI0038910D8D